MSHSLVGEIMETRELLLKAADIEKMAGERKMHFDLPPIS